MASLDGVGDLEAAVGEELHQAVAQDGGVLGDGHADGVGHLGVQRQVDGDHGGTTDRARDVEVTVNGVDPVGEPASPLEEEPTTESRAPPRPSSRTTMRSHWPCWAQLMLALEAWACWTTLARSSATQK